MKLIDKDKVVVEIERRVKEGEKVIKCVPSSAILGLVQAYKNTLSFLDTLEVKEVDINKVIEPVWGEEDEKMLNDAIGAVGAADYYTYDDKQEIENWLKSLKDRLKG